MLNTPRDRGPPKIAVYSNKVPTPDEVPIVPKSILNASTKLLDGLSGVSAKWAVGGDAGELLLGVNLSVDHLEILTTKEGCDEICEKVPELLTLAPVEVEKKVPRDADVEGVMFPVYIKSRYAELNVDGVRVEIYGDEQIKVGEWEWGDSLDYAPSYTYIPGGKLPVVPLSLKSELYLGLGWLDRVKPISDAILQKRHDH